MATKKTAINLDGASYKKSDTGKGTWKSLPVGTQLGGSDVEDPGSGVKIVEPNVADTPKRPGSGIGRERADQAPNSARDSVGDGHPNAWYGPASVGTVKTPETPNPTWKGSYGGYDGGLGDLHDDVTGAGDTNAIIDTSTAPSKQIV